MRVYVENKMTNDEKEADIELNDNILTVRLINEPLWFKCILPESLVSLYTYYLRDGMHLGLNIARVIESNQSIVQSDYINTGDKVNAFLKEYAKTHKVRKIEA